jgi:hypothetical protein
VTPRVGSQEGPHGEDARTLFGSRRVSRPPSTDQLHDGVDRVVKILKDPELRGDRRADEGRPAINKGRRRDLRLRRDSNRSLVSRPTPARAVRAAGEAGFPVRLPGTPSLESPAYSVTYGAWRSLAVPADASGGPRVEGRARALRILGVNVWRMLQIVLGLLPVVS